LPYQQLFADKIVGKSYKALQSDETCDLIKIECYIFNSSFQKILHIT